jgi:REP element-mobilizing transposase RayT
MLHFRVEGSAYFVTWRLAVHQHELAPLERELVVSALKHFHDNRYWLYEYVVMPDHVHAIVQPYTNNTLSSVLHSWKSFMANQLQRLFQRQGAIWQKDTYERIVRGENDLFEKANYILTNPERRWPGIAEYQWRGWAWR